MSGADAEFSQVSVSKSRSWVLWCSRSQISVACLVSERVLKSMHASVEFCVVVGLCECERVRCWVLSVR